MSQKILPGNGRRLRRAAAVILPIAVLGIVIFASVRSHREAEADRPTATTSEAGPVPRERPVDDEGLQTLSAAEAPTPAIDSFAGWMAAHAGNGANLSRSVRAEGVALARLRRAEMKALIVSAPESALAAAIPYEVREKLPAEIVAQLEEPISAKGDYEMIVTCFGPLKPGDSITRQAVFPDRTLQAFTFGRRLDVATKNGISLHGIAIDEVMALADDPVRVIPAGEFQARGLRGGPGIAVEVQGKVFLAGDGGAVEHLRAGLVEGESSLGPRASAGYRDLARGEIPGVTPLEAAAPGDSLEEADSGDDELVEPEEFSAHTEGAKTMLYIRARFSDQAPGFIPISDTDVQTRQGNCEAFWFENSYGKSSLTTTITETVTLSNTAATSSTGGLSALLVDARSAALAAQPPGEDWNYQNYNFYTVLTSGGSFGYGGVAFVGGTGSHLNGAGAANVRTASHEFGHNLGLRHANFWRTDSPSPIGRDTVPGGYRGDNSNDEWVEYGHRFSVMSAQNGSGDMDSGRGHYSSGEKVKLDWLVAGDGDWASITTSQTLRLYRHDVQAANFGTMTTGVTRGIRINLDSNDYVSATNKRRYWLTYRRLPTNGIAETWLRRGLQVDWQRATYASDGSILLDMTPFSRDVTTVGGNYNTDNNDKEDAALIIGRTYSDEVADIHFTPFAQGGADPNEWIDVVIHIGTQSGNTEPEITSYTASATQVNTGVTVNFSAAATDLDGDTLYYSWDFGDFSLVVGSLNSTTASKSWSAAGYYPVRVTASDGKGGTDTREIIVRVGNPANQYRILGRVLHGGLPVEGARVNIGASYQTWTEGDGSYELVGLPTGNHTVTCARLGLTFTPQFTNPVNLTTLNAYGIDFYANEGLGGSGGLTLSVAPYEMVVPLGASVSFAATGWDGAGNMVPATPLWSVSGGGTIDSSGMFTANTLGGPFTVTATDGSASADAFVTVAALEAIGVFATDAAAGEAGPDPGNFRIQRFGSTTLPLTVQFAVGGTAAAGADYVALGSSAQFAATESIVDVPLTVLDDFEAEPAETVQVTLQPNAAYVIYGSLSAATAIIADDGDQGPAVTIISPAAASAAVPAGTGLYLEASASDDGLPNPPGAVSVSWSVLEGPAGASVYFSPPLSPAVVANFSGPGFYRLGATASDGVNAAVAELVVHVVTSPGASPSETGEIVYYSMDDGSGTTADDGRGGDNDGTLANGAAWTAPGGGIAGRGIVLDGTNDQINIADAAEINTDAQGLRTIALWFKAGNPAGATKQVLYQQGGTTRGFVIYLEAGTLYVGGWNNGVNGWNNTFLSTPLGDTGWHHVALVLDADGAVTLQTGAFAGYLDGIEFGRGDGAEVSGHTGDIGIGVMRGGGEFHDGDATGANYWFDGTVDEFHLWNRALSIEELGLLYSWGAAAPGLTLTSLDTVPGSVVIPGGVGIVLNGGVSGGGAPTVGWSELAAPAGGSAAFADAFSPDTTATFSAPGFYSLRLTADDGARISALDVNVHAGINGPANPAMTSEVIYYALDDGSGGGATDSAGGDNDGTLIGGASWTPAGGGISGTAVVFDGVDDVITIANASGINSGSSYTKRTIALWFDATDPGGAAKEVLYEEGGTTRGFNLYLDAGAVYAGAWNVDATGWASTFLGAPVSAGQWHHVALVLDVDAGGAVRADGLKMYLNGSLAGAGAGAELISHTGAIGLGGMQAATNCHDGTVSGDGLYFSGIIDEFHLFNRVLSVDEIGLLYSFGNIGALVDAGPDEPGTPALRALLAGSGSDDGRWMSAPAFAWSVVSGPGAAGFSDPDANGIDTLATCTVAGTYTFRLAADDGQVTTFDESAVTVTGVPYYDIWLAGFPILTGPDTDYLANPDFDVLSNLEEYGQGGNPEPGSGGDDVLPRSAVVEDGGMRYLEITFRRRWDYLARGLSYEVELSEGVALGAAWSAAGYTETAVNVIDAEFEEVTVRVDEPIDGLGMPRCFGRLRITIDE